MPSVCTHCIKGVPPCGLPKTSTSVGRNALPTLSAPALWSTRAKIFKPLLATISSNLSIVALVVCGLLTLIRPSAACTKETTEKNVIAIKYLIKIMRSEERRVGKSVDLGGRRIIKKKKKKRQ